LTGSKIIKNTAWIIGSRIIQSILALIVTMISARYLGPSGYGLINYAASIVAFFVPLMQLGLNSTLVQEIISEPNKEGEVLGTALVLNVCSGVACIVGICSFSAIVNRGEPQTIWVCILYSTVLFFRATEVVQYWFQAKLMSSYTAIVTLVVYIIVAVYRIVLLVTGRSVYWFAISQAIDVGLIAFALLVLYHKKANQKLCFSLDCGKRMFAKSKYYILPNLMITIFSQTDRFMLKQMINDEAVGFYSAAASCASLTAFIFVAIIDSMRPFVLEGKKTSQELFCERMKSLYAVVIFLALSQSAIMTIFAEVVVSILYGDGYTPAVGALKIVVWHSTFSYLGAVRGVWVLAEGKQQYLWKINLSGAAANVILNAMLIPAHGISGAAFASLVTQIFTNVIMGWIIRPISPSNQLMIQSLNLKFICSEIKKLK